MPILLTDGQIRTLLEEPKRLKPGFRKSLRPRAKPGHAEADVQVTGDAGSVFWVRVRQSAANPIDFSVILSYEVPGSNRSFNLRRYNGKAHDHANKLEGDRFYDFHVHLATERYQAEGEREERYAEPTTRFATVDEALECLLRECGFVDPEPATDQLPLDL
jgi:hypothetical protein